jgi:hypothetical protein
MTAMDGAKSRRVLLEAWRHTRCLYWSNADGLRVFSRVITTYAGIGFF